jgi:hypothetical protein
MNRLLDIGFQFAGHWLLEKESIQIAIRQYGEQRNVLYAFICDGEVCYIGQSTQTLRKRMGGYIRPAPDSSTNIKNNRNIRELLAAGAAVDVYVLPDNGLMHYGPYHLNLAAGLEASLIAALTPQWNGHTRKRQQKAPGKGPAGGEVTEYLPESRLEVSEPTEAEGPVEPLPPTPQATFEFRLEDSYWSKGFFNGRKAADPYLGADGDNIEIFVGNEHKPILGNINRTATGNNTPRVFGGPELRNRFQAYPRMTEMVVEVYSPTSIRIRPKDRTVGYLLLPADGGRHLR